MDCCGATLRLSTRRAPRPWCGRDHAGASLLLDAKPLSIERLYQRNSTLGEEMFHKQFCVRIGPFGAITSLRNMRSRS